MGAVAAAIATDADQWQVMRIDNEFSRDAWNRDAWSAGFTAMTADSVDQQAMAPRSVNCDKEFSCDVFFSAQRM